MARPRTLLSIKSLMLYVVMTTSALGLIVTAWIFENRLEHSYQDQLVNDANMFASFLVQNAVASVVFDDPKTAHQDLQHLSSIPFIEHAHLYTYNDDHELHTFASYNRQGTINIEPVFDRINALSSPTFSSNGLEVIRPIMNHDKNIGYIYLNISTDKLHQLTLKAVIITVAIMLVTIILALIVTLYLQGKITRPISDLQYLVQEISINKDYNRRADIPDISELALLADGINRLLTRIQHHMQHQHEAEQEYKELAQNLETKVNQRTIALKQANQELISTLEKLHEFQRQMVQNEKMASLGDMVAGIAHEVNTPIGLGVTASTMMIDRINQIQQDFDEKTLKASVLSKFLSESKENLNIVYRNLNRAADLVSSFKQVAVDQTSEQERIFAVKQLLEEILQSLRPRMKQTQHDIIIDCPDTLTIQCKAGPIHQILINLIMNSLVHGFEYLPHGVIEITVEQLDQYKLKMIYRDNGKGLSEQLKKRIYDPFVTTKRGKGGSGLGMHLVFNLVTQALQGSIDVQSEEGNGVEFTIIFPVKFIEPSQ